jgi:hypothetical protein
MKVSMKAAVASAQRVVRQAEQRRRPAMAPFDREMLRDLRARDADLRGAIYWLLTCREVMATEEREDALVTNVASWLTAHGYDPGSPKARRLLARKRVPR